MSRDMGLKTAYRALRLHEIIGRRQSGKATKIESKLWSAYLRLEKDLAIAECQLVNIETMSRITQRALDEERNRRRNMQDELDFVRRERDLLKTEQMRRNARTPKKKKRPGR